MLWNSANIPILFCAVCYKEWWISYVLEHKHRVGILVILMNINQKNLMLHLLHWGLWCFLKRFLEGFFAVYLFKNGLIFERGLHFPESRNVRGFPLLKETSSKGWHYSYAIGYIEMLHIYRLMYMHIPLDNSLNVVIFWRTLQLTIFRFAAR